MELHHRDRDIGTDADEHHLRGPVAVLGTAVDRSGDTRTVCESDQGPVTIEQN